MDIDLNRGVTIKIDPNTGARVYMYKDTPGVFLNDHGSEVDDVLAKSCGFPLKELKKKRLKREALAKASAEIEAEFEGEEAEQNFKVVRETKDGYKVKQFAFGRCWVFGPDDDKMHDKPLTKAEAYHLLKVLRAPPSAGPEDAGPGFKVELPEVEETKEAK